MPSLRNSVRLTLAMAFVSLASLVFMHLALTDIYHGEADTTLEWRVVQVCALVMIAFIASAVVTLMRVLRQI